MLRMSRRRRATWKLFDLLVDCIDGVISMLKNVGTWSEVTREIWEMKLLTLLPRPELGGQWHHWAMFRARERHPSFWEMAAVSLLHASAVGGAITEPLWSMVCKSLLVPRDWCSVAVSANPWFDVHFFLWVIATQLLIVFFFF